MPSDRDSMWQDAKSRTTRRHNPSARPHLRRDWAHLCHICTGTGASAATSAPGLGSTEGVRRFWPNKGTRQPPAYRGPSDSHRPHGCSPRVCFPFRRLQRSTTVSQRHTARRDAACGRLDPTASHSSAPIAPASAQDGRMTSVAAPVRAGRARAPQRPPRAVGPARLAR